MKKTTRIIIGFSLLAFLGFIILFASVMVWFLYIQLDWLSYPCMLIGLLIIVFGVCEATDTYEMVKRKKKQRQMENRVR